MGQRFSAETLARLEQSVLDTERRRQGESGHRAARAVVNPRIVEGLLDGDLGKSTSAGANPTTATLIVFAVIDGTLQETGEEFTVTNRDDDKEWFAEEYLAAFPIGDELRPITSPVGDGGDDSGAGSGSGSGSGNDSGNDDIANNPANDGRPSILTPLANGDCPPGYDSATLSFNDCEGSDGSGSGSPGNCICVKSNARGPCKDCDNASGSASIPDPRPDGECDVLDTFTDTDSTGLAAHTMDVGDGWTVDVGTPTINGNRARFESNSGLTNERARTPTDSADGTLTTTVNFDTATTGLNVVYIIFRWQDADNHWRLALKESSNLLELEKRVGGTTTVVASSSKTWSTATDYDVSITMDGDSISATVDGTTLGVTDSAFSTEKNIGLWTFGNDAAFVTKFDDFQFCESTHNVGAGNGGCCDEEVGNTLQATVSNVTGCADFEGAEFLLTHNAGLWSGTTSPGDDTLSIAFQCFEGEWNIDGTICDQSFDSSVVEVSSCGPLYVKLRVSVDLSGVTLGCTCNVLVEFDLEIME